MGLNEKFFNSATDEVFPLLIDEVWASGTTSLIQNNGLNVKFPTSSEGTAFPNVNAISSGKWYWEVKLVAITGAGAAIGITDYDTYTRSTAQGTYPADAGSPLKMLFYNGAVYYGDGYNSITTGFTSQLAANNIIGFALDADNSTFTMSKNNSWMLGYTPGTSNAITNFSWTNTQIWYGHGSQNAARSTTWGIVPYTSLNYSVPSGYTALKGDFTAQQVVK
tara:strand:- start:265 stop:927 length:663 start_codon:yes stop_codon:yes gene_type:complete